MKDIKEVKMQVFVTMMMLALTFSVTLVSTPSISAKNGGKQVSPPDIKITNITFSDDTPVEGEEITIYATVLNNDSMPVGNVTITFYVDSKALGNATDITIKANESIISNITWVAEKWTHNISVMASIGDAQLMNTRIGKEIYADARPIGDTRSLVLALIIIFIIVIGTSFIPSIWESIINVRMKVRK
ncbi:MAG: CARDB domain-containing protein [Candidatus Thermoplasmatota archaeon]